jgi:hypothetical protein
MLPVNVEGITWLTTNYTAYNTPIILGVISYVLLTLSCCIALIVAFFWFSFKEKYLTLYLIAIFVCCMISFLAIYHGEKKNRENFIPEPISYVVYIEDNADYKTLIQNYTIESEQDNLTTIVLKEN